MSFSSNHLTFRSFSKLSLPILLLIVYIFYRSRLNWSECVVRSLHLNNVVSDWIPLYPQARKVLWVDSVDGNKRVGILFYYLSCFNFLLYFSCSLVACLRIPSFFFYLRCLQIIYVYIERGKTAEAPVNQMRCYAGYRLFSRSDLSFRCFGIDLIDCP